MVTVGLLVCLAAKPGPFSFGIFDAFPDEIARQAHLAGGVAAVLMARAEDLLAAPPDIECVETFSSKLPRGADTLLPTGVLRPDGANDE